MDNKKFEDKELEDKLGKFALFFFIFLGIPLLILFINLYTEESKEIKNIKNAEYEEHIFKVVKIDDKPLARYVYLESEKGEIYVANFKKTSKVDLIEIKMGENRKVKHNKYDGKYYLPYYSIKMGDYIERDKELTYLKDGIPKELTD